MKRLVAYILTLVSTVLFAGTANAQALPIDYPVVYVKFPKLSVGDNYTLPEVHYAVRMPPGRHSDLVVLYPDGHEEVLARGGDGAIVDPVVSFDAKWVYYAKFHNVKWENYDQGYFFYPRLGSDIYKVNVQTKQIIQITNQEWTPASSVIDRTRDPLTVIGKRVFNLGPCPLPSGKIMYTTSKNSYVPAGESDAIINLQLAVMDDNGKNQEVIGHFNLGSAMHPHILKDGRVLFSSGESQGIRSVPKWGLWTIWPDGTKWEPWMSAFMETSAFHFHTELSNGDIAFMDYYHQNNRGFGILLSAPNKKDPTKPSFFGPFTPYAPEIPVASGERSHTEAANSFYPFAPYGLKAVTPFTHRIDTTPFRDSNGVYMGKVTQPAGAPNNDIMIIWSGGAVGGNNIVGNEATLDAGIYLIKNGTPVGHPSQMVLIKNDPLANEMQAKPLVPYSRIYGVPQPRELTPLRNNGGESIDLPSGTPFGIIGTSSFIKRDTMTGIWDRRLNPKYRRQTGYLGGWSNNMLIQGGDTGFYENDDIYAVRIVAQDPTLDRGAVGQESRIRSQFANAAFEPLRILGEIPLLKRDVSGNLIKDIEGNSDTSFLAKIPADVSFTFQTIDKNGMNLNVSQTWHQLRPGEVRNDCGGCHAHSQAPLDFKTTAAAKPDYRATDLTQGALLLTKNAAGATVTKTISGPLNIEYHRDIKPILQRSCVGCHFKGNTAGRLVFNDTNINPPETGTEETYKELRKSIWPFQSRRSYLTWKIYGKRMDGLTNEDLASPDAAGNLPAGVTYYDADIDYKGTIMPPPGSGHQSLSEEEKMMITRWIDLGMPSNAAANIDSRVNGWFLDPKPPTVSLVSPRTNVNSPSLDEIRIGMNDYYSGLDESTFQVIADFAVNGKAAGTNLAPEFSKNALNSVWTLRLNPPITTLENAKLTVRVKDRAGNLEEINRIFSVSAVPRPRAPTGVEGNAVK